MHELGKLLANLSTIFSIFFTVETVVRMVALLGEMVAAARVDLDTAEPAVQVVALLSK